VGKLCEVPAKPKRGGVNGEQRQADTSQSEEKARHCKHCVSSANLVAFRRILVMSDQASPAFREVLRPNGKRCISPFLRSAKIFNSTEQNGRNAVVSDG